MKLDLFALALGQAELRLEALHLVVGLRVLLRVEEGGAGLGQAGLELSPAPLGLEHVDPGLGAGALGGLAECVGEEPDGGQLGLQQERVVPLPHRLEVDLTGELAVDLGPRHPLEELGAIAVLCVEEGRDLSWASTTARRN
jgi:hypothetical protein